MQDASAAQALPRRSRRSILEREDPVLAPNVKCIAAVLQESGRDFSVDDVYNFFSSTRTPRNYNHRRLEGAQIIKL